jgi:hypothetical protein
VQDHREFPATATVARFVPRRRAIAMPQAFRLHHFFVQTSSAWAPSNSAVRIIASQHFDTRPLWSVSPDA